MNRETRDRLLLLYELRTSLKLYLKADPNSSAESLLEDIRDEARDIELKYGILNPTD